MHIAFFSDQHPATLGGLQVSLGLQRQHLEHRGHTVTVCAPKSKRTPSPRYARPDDVSVGSIQVGEHSFSLAGLRFDDAIDLAFARKPSVDCVHVQGDVWGAWNGYRFAARHDLPLVHTMHTNIEAGLPAILPFPRTVFRLLYAAQQRFLGAPTVRSIADYTRAFADRADLIIAPSTHFAERLHSYGIDEEIHVLPTGVDDALLSIVRNTPRSPRSRPVLLWPGRVSQEKRIVDFFEAFARAEVNADIHIYGAGNDLAHARRKTVELGIGSDVTFFGAVPHQNVLWAMRDADAVVQSSINYETQGLTVYEAVSVGTPVILRDRKIALDLPAQLRHTAADGSIDAFAAAIRTFVHDDPRARPRFAPSDEFAQSHLTLKAEALYLQAQVIHERRHAIGLTRGAQYAA
ncbi:glycosyltransferase [Microbacterium murale]|uniref:D-inositol 3-phosphate glycosyltransferase n=1 Tax=Microbacterium murale TaxID=1081040 RepID=A0ABU0PDE2_9MICO|nr:glycosyltransferase [Microbacterium murale]MDQ0645350.1 1,2-diacylglycerol 3-alpha-glucosyltransferase [Microbacterium murale]